MGVTIYIGGSPPRSLEEADAPWITQQVQERIKVGEPVCVRVVFDTEEAKFALATPACGSKGGGGGQRSLTRAEQDILDLWVQHRLNQGDINPGDVVAFIKRLTQLL